MPSFKWTKDVFNRISFRAQLLISFLLLGVMIISIMLISFYTLLKNKVMEEYESQLNFNLEQLKDNLDSKMRHYEEIVNQITLSNNEDFKAQDKMMKYLKIIRYLGNLREANKSSLAKIKIYENGDTIYKDDINTANIEDVFEIEIMNKLRTQVNNYYIKETWRDSRGQKIFSYYARIPVNVFQSESLVELCIYETDYYGLINEISKEYDVCILSDEDYVISATNRDIIGESAIDLDGSILNYVDINNELSHIVVNNLEYIVVTGKTENNQTIIISSELTKAMKEFSMSFTYILIIALVVTVLALVLTLMLSNRLANRMSQLKYKIKLLRKGNFEKQVVISGKDEFSNLSSDIDKTREELKSLIEEIKRTGELKTQAELDALMSQINRHFLFNALSSIKCIAMERQEKTIEESIDLLGSFIRISLIRLGYEISVAKELKHLEAYIHFERLRHQEKIDIVIEMKEEIKNFETVKFILQPLVENSIYHGLKSGDKQLKIWIRAYAQNNQLIFEVEDNGVGISREKITEILNGVVITKLSGFGISNINQRIKLFHGEGYGIKIESELGEKTIFRINQPLVLTKDELLGGF